MVIPNAGLCSHVAENKEGLKLDNRTHNSNIVKKRGGVHLLNSARDGVRDSACDVGAGSAVGSLGMHVKDLDKEVSPLPVKHFDFSFEAKSLDKEIQADANNMKPESLTTKETTASISQLNSRCFNLTCSSSKDQMSRTLPDAQQTSSKCTDSKMIVEHLNENSHTVACNTPNSDYKMVVASMPKNNCTPASSSTKGCLDLSNWLPLEICHIYYKKGISKLYPWQVTLPPLVCLDQFLELVHWSDYETGECIHCLHVTFLS